MHRLALTTLSMLSIVLCLRFYFALPALMAGLGAEHATAAVPWQTIAAQKRERERDMAKIPPEWRLPQDVLDQSRLRRSIADDFIDSLLDSDSKSLTNLDAPAVMAMTANGSLTAVRLTTAFCKRAAYAHQLNRNLLNRSRQRHRAGQDVGCFLGKASASPGAAPWPSRHHEGPVSRQGNGHHYGLRRLDGQLRRQQIIRAEAQSRERAGSKAPVPGGHRHCEGIVRPCLSIALPPSDHVRLNDSRAELMGTSTRCHLLTTADHDSLVKQTTTS